MATKIYIGNNEIGTGGASGNISVVYISKDDYDDLVDEGTVDSDVLYVINDLADTDDLAELVTTSAMQAAVNTATSAVVNGAVADVNTAKNTAVSAVQAQQATSVSAVQAAAADLPGIEVLTEAQYNALSVIDPDTLYFITEQTQAQANE